MVSASISNEFVMYGAREAMAQGLAHIAEQVKAIEKAVAENPGFAFDLSKTIVESTCKTILNERRISFAGDDDLPKLYKKVLACVPLLPAHASGEATARRSLARTLGGMHGALQGVCELRSNYGFASHGSDGLRPPMHSIQAQLAAQSADTIVGFLYGAHRSSMAPGPGVSLAYGDNPEFNDYIDDTHQPVKIFELEYKASEVLFATDRDAYADALKSYRAQAVEGDNEKPPSREDGE